ncbi:aminopeptidase P family protein [Neolewinella aurantiaca]|uniref:Aminopeptidase P family protein n=1 Tax=Neolewinella aurantiaca TaxID=2602767 RepID=A0A5C7FLS0_9BACT|nr:aminopeptidase P family protein [Neolewinella aurantiaca]TXF88312.1 aminopeptidase P family protein [Neolewinella aurantiaca]
MLTILSVTDYIALMTTTEKLAALRRAMLEAQIDAYIIPSTDPHQSEYPAPRWASREWVSGFTGSAGTLVVTLHEAKLWTDSRYFLQANTQLEGTGIELMKSRQPDSVSIENWLGATLMDGQTVGTDGRVTSLRASRAMRRKLEKLDLKFTLDEDLIRNIWSDRPPVPGRPVFEHTPDYTGESWQARLQRFQQWMGERNLDYFVVSALDEVAWLLNIRGSDIDFNPLCVAYLVIGSKGDHAIFATARPGFSTWTEGLPAGQKLTVHSYDKVSSYLRRLNALNADIGIDPGTISARLAMHAGADSTTEYTSPVPGWKAIKNEVSLGHLRTTMAHDAVALLRLRRWLGEVVPEGITEAEVARKLTALRATYPSYVTDSFPAIVGYAGNGAIVHYRAPEKGSAKLEAEGLLLIDSGGQYHTGTTDITRTFALGETTEEMRKAFTLVLMGHIDLAVAKFPTGTTGVQLDVLARGPLWRNQMNYGHGTGHGVGFFLNVHEGPAGILTNPKSPSGQKKLEPGMVLSNEPGYYKDGEFGIRTENLVVIREASQEGWLEFETITLFPIDRSLIEQGMLLRYHVDWINDYHKMVLERVSPLVEGEELDWLLESCKAL